MKHQYLCLDKDKGEYFVTTERCSSIEDAKQYVGDHIVLRPIVEGDGGITNPIVCGECQECEHFYPNEDNPNDEYFGVCLCDNNPACDAVVPKIGFGCTWFESRDESDR